MRKLGFINFLLGFAFAILVYLPLVKRFRTPILPTGERYNASGFSIELVLKQSTPTKGLTVRDKAKLGDYQKGSKSLESELNGPMNYLESFYNVKGSKCHPNQIDFSEKEWDKEFKKRRECTFHNYTEHIPNRKDHNYVDKSDSPYSSLFLYEMDGVHCAYLTNVCMSLISLTFTMFSEKSKFNERLDGFQHLWVFKTSKSTFPASNDSMNFIWDKDGAWMIIPGWQQHTSHFSENMLMINHRSTHPDNFPPMKDIFLPRFNGKKEIKWTKEVLEALKQTHPVEGPNAIRFYPLDDMKSFAESHKNFCWRHLAISGHINHDGRGGYFPFPYEADNLRGAMYLHFKVEAYKFYQGDHKRLDLLYLPRDTKSLGRQLLNVEEMERMILSMPSYFTYNTTLIHKIPVVEQARITADSDIIISVHGAAMATIIFMLPYSTYIELRPPNFRDNWYQLLCNQARLNHVAMNNFSHPLPPTCPSIKATLDPVRYQRCWKAVHYANYYVCVECLRNVLLQQYHLVRALKYGLCCVSSQTL